jgi:plastocyanin
LRRVLALLLVTPLLANCSDSPAPLTPPDAPHSHEAMLEEEAAWTLQYEEGAQLQGAPNSGAVMQFGNPQLGTSYPAGSHDDSFHARWRLRPGTVVIDAGQTVTFEVGPSHRVAIYDDGVRPEDIPMEPGPFVLYPVNRLVLQPTPVPTYTYTFTKPGRYLVICAITRHFFEGTMYGWVIVR